MTTMSYYEARTHFSELLDQVAKGKTILITRRGKPAAVLGPPPTMSAKDVKQVAEQLLHYRDQQKRTLGTLSVREMREMDHRF